MTAKGITLLALLLALPGCQDLDSTILVDLDRPSPASSIRVYPPDPVLHEAAARRCLPDDIPVREHKLHRIQVRPQLIYGWGRWGWGESTEPRINRGCETTT